MAPVVGSETREFHQPFLTFHCYPGNKGSSSKSISECTRTPCGPEEPVFQSYEIVSTFSHHTPEGQLRKRSSGGYGDATLEIDFI